MKYRLLIDYEVIEFLENLSRKDQQLLRKHFIAILGFPRQFSDYTEPDSVGRPVDIHICGRFAIKYWKTLRMDTSKSWMCILPTKREIKSPVRGVSAL
jgi:hypothetical protein